MELKRAYRIVSDPKRLSHIFTCGSNPNNDVIKCHFKITRKAIVSQEFEWLTFTIQASCLGITNLLFSSLRSFKLVFFLRVLNFLDKFRL